MEDVERRLLDRDGDASRELGLLREWGDRERGEVGATGSRLVAEVTGDLERETVCVYGSDLLRIRDPARYEHLKH